MQHILDSLFRMKIVVVVFVLQTLSTFSNCDVEVEVPYDYISAGKNIDVQCKVTNEKFLGWVAPSGYVVNNTVGRIYVVDDGDKHTLKIKNIDETLTGKYLCKSESGSEEYNLYIEFIFPTPKPFQELIAGEDGLIECRVAGSPPPVITWYKDGKKLNFSVGSRYRLYSNGSLWLHYVTVEDAGSYICLGKQGRRSEENKIEVEVLVPPNFIQKPAHARPTEGYQVTFFCGAMGVPNPEIAWFKDDKQILSGGHYEIRDGNLVILNVQKDDVGNYTCRVFNKAGSAETQATIEFVYVDQIIKWIEKGGKSVPPKINPVVDLYVNVTSRVEIECKASGDPLPRVSWWKHDGEDISDLQMQSPGKSVLLLPSVQESDQGKYVCKAENGAEDDKGGVIKDAIKMMLYVQTPPVFNENKSSHILYSYLNNPNKVELRCVLASGFPEAVMTMVFPMENPVGAYAKGLGSLSYAVITDQEDEFGTYKCVARNILGRVEHDIEVKQVVAPSIPRNLSVLAFCDSLTVSWFTPESDGGRPVENYVIDLYYQKDLIKEIMLNGSTKNTTFSGLGRGLQYVVQMQAKNMAGFSKVVKQIIKTPSPDDVISLDIYENYTSPDKSVSVRCTVTCDPFVGWFDPQGESISVSEGDVRVEDDGNTHILHITNMKRSKPAGKYYCRSSAASAAYTLYIWIGFLNAAPQQYLLSNNTDVINCEVKGVPTPLVRWFKNETEVVGPRFQVLSSGSLEVTNPGKKDNGIYKCSVKQGNKIEERMISVAVVSMPSFTKTPENKLGTEGIDTSFSCSATGDPQPEIIWLNSSGKPLKGPRYFTKDGILTVAEVRPSDLGKYICRAQSVAGYIDVSAYIKEVYTRPRILIPPQDTVTYRGQNVSFLCKTRGNPTPTIYWQDSTGRVLGYGPTLKIDSVVEDIEGLYYCVVRNQVGKTKAAARLTVRKGQTMNVRQRSGTTAMAEKQLLALFSSLMIVCLALMM